MRIRPILAIACCLTGAGALLLQAQDASRSDSHLLTGMAAIVLVAALLLALRPMWAALAGRGLLWTTLAMATLADSVTSPTWTFTTTALAMCAALLVLGRHALDRPTAAFQPNHHRGALTLALVLGFADVATLSGWSLLAFSDGGQRAMEFAMVFSVLAIAIAVSLVGLYRLRTWGFLLNLGVNLAVVLLMLFDAFHMYFARLVFIVPALAQILIALPVLVAIVRRRPLTLPASIARLSRFVPATAIVVMAALNIQAWFGEPMLRTLVRWGMSHF
jgi:hypothetical protein